MIDSPRPNKLGGFLRRSSNLKESEMRKICGIQSTCRFKRESSPFKRLSISRKISETNKRAYALSKETLQQLNHQRVRWFIFQKDLNILIQRNTRLSPRLQQLKHPIIANTTSIITSFGFQNIGSAY